MHGNISILYAKLYACFETSCLRDFSFLQQKYGFKVSEIRKEQSGCFITYKNSTTGVRVSLEPWEGYVFLLLIRLVDGDPTTIESGADLERFHFNDLLKLRLGSDIPQGRDDVYEETKIQAIVCQYAQNLERYGEDVLKGDFTVFADLQQIVQKRAQYFKDEML